MSVCLYRPDGLDIPYTGDLKVNLRVATEFDEDAATDLTPADARMMAAALGCYAERVEQEQVAQRPARDG